MATVLMVMKEPESPLKEIVIAFLASERKCKLDKETRERLCTILDNYDQDVPLFPNMETLPRRTDPSTRDSEGQLSAASISKVKMEQKSRSDSSDSKDEEVKRLPAGEVTTPSKMEKRKALFLLLKASPETEALRHKLKSTLHCWAQNWATTNYQITWTMSKPPKTTQVI